MCLCVGACVRIWDIGWMLAQVYSPLQNKWMLTGEDKRGVTEVWTIPNSFFHLMVQNISVDILKPLQPSQIKNTGIKINIKNLPDDNLLSGGCIIDFSIIRDQSIQFKALSRKMGPWNWFKGTMITRCYRIKMAQGSIVLLLQYFNKWPSSNGGNAGADVMRFPDAGDIGA